MIDFCCVAGFVASFFAGVVSSEKDLAVALDSPFEGLVFFSNVGLGTDSDWGALLEEILLFRLETSL